MILNVVFQGFKVVNVELLSLSIMGFAISSVGVALSKSMSSKNVALSSLDVHLEVTSSVDNQELESGQSNSSVAGKTRDELLGQQSAGNVLFGAAAAALGVGVCGSMVPFTSQYAPKNLVPEFGFVPSFGIGVLVTMPAVVLCMWLCARGLSATPLPAVEQWSFLGSMPYGFLAGVLWGIGNSALLFGMAAGVAPPTAIAIWQLGLIVSGIHGMWLFHEIVGVLPSITFFVSAGICLAAIVLEGRAIAPPR